MSRQKQLDKNPYPDFVFEIEYDQPPRQRQRRREPKPPMRRRKLAGFVLAVAALPGIAHYDGWTAGSENSMVQFVDAIGSVESDIVIGITGAEDERDSQQAGSRLPAGEGVDPDPTSSPEPDTTGAPTQTPAPSTGPTAKPPTKPSGITIADVLAHGRPIAASPTRPFKLPPSVLTPQGLGGTGTAGGYTMNGQPAVNRNILMVSSYRGNTTRLALIDVDQKRISDVELLKRRGSKLVALSSHGSGFAMAGQYLYSSSRGELFMYKADGFIKRGNGYALPAVARWSVNGKGGFSSIFVDTSRTPNQLVGINYTKGGASYVQRFNLAKDGLLAASQGRGSLALNNSYGFSTKSIRSVDTLRVPGNHYQGVGSITIPGKGQYTFAANSGHTMTIMNGRRKVGTYPLMERGVSESLYYDPKEQAMWHMNEHAEFIYSIPISKILARAR